MGADVCFEPGSLRLISDLDDMCEGNRTVVTGKIFNCRLLAIEFSVEGFFNFGDNGVDIDRRLGRCDVFCTNVRSNSQVG